MKLGILLAAGHGKRMKSETPKVLLDLNGEPLCFPALRALFELCEKVVVVVGYRAGDVKTALQQRAEEVFQKENVGLKLKFVTQEIPQGTGDAVRVAVQGLGNELNPGDDVFVINGDVGLVTTKTLEIFYQQCQQQKFEAGFASINVPDPTGFGRVLRKADGAFLGIREEADSNESEKRIQEVNGGLYLFKGSLLQKSLDGLNTNNSQKEFYLTDIFKGPNVGAVLTPKFEELLGANTQWELAELRRLDRQRYCRQLAEDYGVDFVDPSSVYISKKTIFRGPCRLGPNIVIKGRCSVGEGVQMDGNHFIEDCDVQDRVHLKWGTVAHQSILGADSKVGPMAHLRPGTVLEEKVSLGNFVETKNMKLGRGAKANHLSYLGDGEIGAETNIGCGTITCNYDGFQKHRTVVGKNVFIGSDTQLVAPIEIGDGAYVASGTTVTDDIPSGALAIARAELIIKPGYAEKLAQKIKERKKT